MQSLESLLRNILLSHVIVREINENNNKTLIRIHLIHQNSNTCERNNIKQKRNTHVSHLPKYKKIKDNTLENNSVKYSNITNCSICQNNFIKGEYFRELPICKHIYHKKCIDKWFYTDLENMKCPMCRTSHTKEKLNTNG